MQDVGIVIAGAGSIGCFVGGLLAAAGRRVTLLARPRIIREIADNGLTLTDFAGLSCAVGQDALTVTDDPACLAAADLVLVTVKSPATEEMAGLIARFAPEKAPVVSLQNGIENAETLRSAMPGRDVRAGMVAFNVVPMGEGRFHRATSGGIVIGAGDRRLEGLLSAPGLDLSESAEITAIQWGKLLLNLNNALNALSGLRLQDMMMDRNWRRLMAAQMHEALTVLKQAGIAVKSPTPLPAWAGPLVLRLPTPLFTRVASRALVVDPEARSSMAYDLIEGRPTEIDSLQGKVIALGRAHGVATPVSERIAAAVGRAEAAGAGLPMLKPGDLA